MTDIIILSDKELARFWMYRHKEAMIAVETDENSPILIDSETFRHIENILNIFDREDNYENTPG